MDLSNKSDSDGSNESCSQESMTNINNNNNNIKENNLIAMPAKNVEESGQSISNTFKIHRRNSEWEILEGLKDGQRYEKQPKVFKGYLHKKRKWPLKGWHKRFFIVDKGILIYGKNPIDVARGKIHGSVDVGLSVISAKSKGKRLDIDAEEFIYHLKAKQYDIFCEWVEHLRQHRLYRQHVLNYGTQDIAGLFSHMRQTPGSSPQKVKSTKWAYDLVSLQSVSSDLNRVQVALGHLDKMLLVMDTSPQIGMDTDDTASPCVVKKDRRKFGLRRKKRTSASSSSNNVGTTAFTTTSCPSSNVSTYSDHTQILNSQQQNQRQDTMDTLSVTSISPTRPHSLPPDSHHFVDFQLSHEFQTLAKDIHSNLKSILYALMTEKERMKTALEDEEKEKLNGSASSYRTALNQALQQNADLRSRLELISRHANISDLPDLSKPGGSGNVGGILRNSLSYSGSEFYFDAQEDLMLAEKPTAADKSSKLSTKLINSEFDVDEDDDDEDTPRNNKIDQVSDTSSVAGSVTSEDQGSVSSEASELAGSEYNIPMNNDVPNMGRRSKLPAPRPTTEGVSLWNLLTKNIGKDLSQVSMPVALNEPLNMLQRLCEELEYSELLDKASELSDNYERMVYVAAFAVSCYGAGFFRAGSKPFNPLLGETYECIREDKGFKFIAEQVSHHPPISICHAESKNFIFSQDARIKTKFWGKSMEFLPAGYVSLKLNRPDNNGSNNYRWNKVTTCVHNLFSAQRWVDQYGELTVNDLDNDIYCKLTFVKASYWSAKRHEVYGVIMDRKENRVVRNLFGKWSESLYCGVAPTAKLIWRPGTMPEDFELYYGFTRFAIELNELEMDSAPYLPPTDTRFRPDQRLLECGELSKAESTKLRLEHNQREKRKRLEALGVHHNPKWFRRVDNEFGETYEFTNKYWDSRANGFVDINFGEPLW